MRRVDLQSLTLKGLSRVFFYLKFSLAFIFLIPLFSAILKNKPGTTLMKKLPSSCSFKSYLLILFDASLIIAQRGWKKRRGKKTAPILSACGVALSSGKIKEMRHVGKNIFGFWKFLPSSIRERTKFKGLKRAAWYFLQAGNKSQQGCSKLASR